MSTLRWLGLFVLNLIALVTAPFIVIPFAIAQRVPYWLNTPDDPRLETQGLYEPQVQNLREIFGQRFKTWYWLGVRNQMYGLFYLLAPKADIHTIVFRTNPRYPQTKNPFIPGICWAYAVVNGNVYHEFNAVWAWSATKCAQVRLGYKLVEMDFPGPVMFCFQIKPFLTRDSTT